MNSPYRCLLLLPLLPVLIVLFVADFVMYLVTYGDDRRPSYLSQRLFDAVFGPQ